MRIQAPLAIAFLASCLGCNHGDSGKATPITQDLLTQSIWTSSASGDGKEVEVSFKQGVTGGIKPIGAVGAQQQSFTYKIDTRNNLIKLRQGDDHGTAEWSSDARLHFRLGKHDYTLAPQSRH
jgi:hypothetical protein